MIEGCKALVLVFIVAVLQATVFAEVDILGGTPDVVLVVLVCSALLRGAATGALCGFLAGLVLDVALLDTLGVTSLLLVLVGYGVGRYGESFTRDRRPGATLAVVATTVVYAIGALALRSVLGESPSPRVVLVDNLFPTLAINALVALPVFALCRRAFRALPPREGLAGRGGRGAGGGGGMLGGGHGAESELVG